MSRRPPDSTVTDEIEAHGLEMQWASSIAGAVALLNSPRERTIVVTEVALPDGNWRDLVERVRSTVISIPIVLVAPAITAELWWDALECGIDDILPASVNASGLFKLLEKQFAP